MSRTRGRVWIRAASSLDMHILGAVLQRINKWVMYHQKNKSWATNKSVVPGAEFEYRAVYSLDMHILCAKKKVIATIKYELYTATFYCRTVSTRFMCAYFTLHLKETKSHVHEQMSSVDVKMSWMQQCLEYFEGKKLNIETLLYSTHFLNIQTILFLFVIYPACRHVSVQVTPPDTHTHTHTHTHTCTCWAIEMRRSFVICEPDERSSWIVSRWMGISA